MAFSKNVNVPAPALFIFSGTIQYIGAGMAVTLFAVMAEPTVACLRLLIGGVLLLAWRRPRLFSSHPKALNGKNLAWAAALGATMAGMNCSFYESISRIPLGTAVSLEFFGPVILAVVGLHGWRARLSVVLALAGVFSIGGIGLDLSEHSQRLGVVFVALAGIFWALYILAGRLVSQRGHGLDSVGFALFFGGIYLTPLAGADLVNAAGSWRVAAMTIGVGFCSGALPYLLDMLIFARIPAPLVALLSALLPLTSLLVGLVMLGQVPSPGELAGLVLISTAVWMSKGQNV